MNTERSRGLLKNRAYEELKEMILARKFPPGSFLSERDLADQLGMSITPIRSALDRLKFDGVVDVSPQQGAVVRNLSFKEVEDLFELRWILETYIVRQIAGRLTAQQITILVDNIQHQEKCLQQENILCFSKLDTSFHVHLSKFHGNREMEKMMLNASDKFNLVFSDMLHRHPARIQAAYREHSNIIEELIHGDAQSAATQMELHLTSGKKLLS